MRIKYIGVRKDPGVLSLAPHMWTHVNQENDGLCYWKVYALYGLG